MTVFYLFIFHMHREISLYIFSGPLFDFDLYKFSIRAQNRMCMSLHGLIMTTLTDTLSLQLQGLQTRLERRQKPHQSPLSKPKPMNNTNTHTQNTFTLTLINNSFKLRTLQHLTIT